jgi:hypothetical protein
MKLSSVMLAILVGFAGMDGAQQPKPKMAPAKSGVAAEKVAQPKFEAIWEPVNYKRDLTLTGRPLRQRGRGLGDG